jgi:hypothetical protein
MKKETRALKNQLIEKITNEVINNGKTIHDMASSLFIKNGKVYLDNCLGEWSLKQMGVKGLKELYEELK